MMRLAPQAQQMSEPLLAAALPYRVVTSPVVGIILFSAANTCGSMTMLTTLLGKGTPELVATNDGRLRSCAACRR